MSANPDTATPTGRKRRTTFALAVPLPSLAEQPRIVAHVERRLSVVEELESVVTANSDKSRDSVLQRTTRFRQLMLQRALSGEQ